MASREGYDIFSKYGRQHFWRDLRRRRFNGYVWRDTLGRFVCAVLGHREYMSDYDRACKRCCKYL